jgi:Zn-dependent M28 family amino/carboxypeptidase
MLLEAAGALARSPRPPRSILFVALAAEEAGLIGSDYFLRAPPVSPEAMVANVNIEGIGLLFPVRAVMGVGARLSTLGRELEAATRAAGLEAAEETAFAKTLFLRSDQYSFGRLGVPGIMPLAAPRSADPKTDGQKLQDRWMAEVYHSPDDEDGPAIHYASAARLADVCARLALRLAEARERPRWLQGSYLAKMLASRGSGRSAVQ